MNVFNVRKTVASLQGQFVSMINDLEEIQERESINITTAQVELNRAKQEEAAAGRFKDKLRELVE